MIKVDFSFAIAVYLVVLLLILLIAWWAFNRRQKGRTLDLDPKHIWYCSICSYTYISTKDEKITTCPRCGSYNKKQS